ncbi:hypothetical protein, partial [Aquicella lusitana]|uniref:hypothetical protein n=1 Tax=Aquicella lusitana TaxID=254246 RepID=UPI001B883C77
DPIRPEPVAQKNQNGWPNVTGIGGLIRSEYTTLSVLSLGMFKTTLLMLPLIYIALCLVMVGLYQFTNARTL